MIEKYFELAYYSKCVEAVFALLIGIVFLIYCVAVLLNVKILPKIGKQKGERKKP